MNSTNKSKERHELQLDNFNNIIRITLLFVLAGLPLVYVPIGIDKGNFDQFFLPKVIVMFILVFAFLIILIFNHKKIGNFIDNDITNKFLLFYFLLQLVSLFFTDNLLLAILGRPDRSEGLITFFMYFVLFLMGRFLNKIDDKFFMVIMFTAIIVSAYGIFQHFGIDPFPRNYRTINYGKSSFSTMGNPNFLGSYLVLMIPIAVYSYIIKKRNSGALCYSILLFCLLCTNTRGAWLGTIFSAICFFAIHLICDRNFSGFIKRYSVIVFISVIIVLLYNFLEDETLINRFMTIFFDAKEFLISGDKSDYTGSHRGFIWKRVLALIENRPITGYGIENLGETFIKYFNDDMIEFWGETRYVDKAHNDFLNIAVTTGIPSMIVYLLFIISVIKTGLSNLKNPLILLLLPSISGYLIAIFFNISVTSVAYIYWVFLGMIASNNKAKAKYEF